ncbi:odorant receptor 4-like [Chironomus tepperi]|uniref:odorant receptor 4-like n=1 Tax=Chironomus tepperi TaxID=113505 RepID=UPI00391EE4B6
MTKIVVDFHFYYIKCIKIFNLISLVFQDYNKELSRKEYLKILSFDALYLLLTLNATVFFGLSTHLLYNGENNVKTLVFAISSTLSMIRNILRFIIIFRKKMEIGDVMEIMKTSYDQAQVDEFEIVAYLNYFKLMRNMLLVSASFIMLFLNIEPLIRLIFHGELNFPINSPFESGKINIYLYPFAYLWTVFNYTYIVINTGLFDFVLCSLIITLAIEFRILSTNFKTIKTRMEGNDEIIQEMKLLIDRHNELFIIKNKLENIFSFPLLCNLLSNSFIACFVAFSATISSGFTNMIDQAFLCAVILLLVYTQCFFGQMLKDASESVVNAIYECGWEDINDIQIRRAFISIIQRSQKTECLTIMKFGDVTLKQFSTVLSYAYSFYTVFCRLDAQQ